jgi:hypothetical protein
MSTEPSINWNFARAPLDIDARATFARASVGRGIDRLGRLEARPANGGRWRFNPATRLCEGLLIESQRTNLALRSEEFDNASWTKTDITVTADSVAAPDGTTTADTLAATAVDANAAQAVTITAGRGVAFAVWLRAGATSFAALKLSAGGNTVECWFNLSTGATATNTAGASSLLYSSKDIIDHGGGWYRCILMVLTSAVTTITASISPAAADNTAAADTDSVYAWGAQIEAAATSTNPTSYIPTTTATVTRSADYLTIPTDGRWYSSSAGTLYWEGVMQTLSPVGNAEIVNLLDLSADADNEIRVTRTSNAVLTATITAAGVATALAQSATLTAGARVRAAVAWANNDIAFTVNGAAPSTSTSAALPSAATTLAVGNRGYSVASSLGAFAAVRAIQYYPRRLSGADLITLTGG